MKQDLNFKSSTKIEKLLTQLLKAGEEIRGSEFNITDVVLADLNTYNPMLRAIFENRYISEHFDPDTVLELIQYAYYTAKPKTGTEYLNAFRDIFQKVRKDWIAIIPLEYNQLFSTRAKFRPTILGDHMIVAPLKNKRAFVDFFQKRFSVTKIDESLLEHQAHQTGGFLYSDVLFVFAVHGSSAIAQWRSQQDLSLFRQLHNLYTAQYGERSTLVTVQQKQNPVNHGLLLNKKDGEIERYPLRESPRLLTRLDGTLIRTFIRRDFSKLFSLLSQNRSKNSLLERMLRALYFFSRGFEEQDRLAGFLFYVISAEALFSRDRDTPISATLADYVSLISANPHERLETHKKVRDIYRLRSSIVHSGSANVAENDLEQTQTLVAHTLLTSLRSLLPPIGLKSEDQFFQELMKLKLRVKSQLRTQPIGRVAAATEADFNAEHA